MFKKLISWCLLILFVIPLPAMASFSDDVQAFEARYPEIYGTIDPALGAKMETFLEDVVDYVIDNYDATKDINNQIQNAVGSVLLTGETYKNDLMPFMLEQAVNKDAYRTQLSEMQAIVRKEVQERLAAQTSPGSGGGPSGSTTETDPAITAEVTRQIAAGNQRIILDLGDKQSVTVTAATLEAIANAGKELELKIAGVTFKLPAQSLNLTSGSTLAISSRTLNTADTAVAKQKLSAGQTIVGSVYELNNGTVSSSQGVQFQKPITIVLSYAGLTVPRTSVNVLDVYYLNETTGKWEAMNGTVDQANQTISFTTTHFSKYAILSSSPAVGSKFTDLPADHWAATEIDKMVQLGLVSGISSTEFAPERSINRAEFTTLLVRALGITPTAQVSGRFKDVPADQWYFSVVNTAAEAGLVSGLSANTFGPTESITREQMAVMIKRALSSKGIITQLDASTINTKLASFADQTVISDWARDGVAAVVNAGIVKGRSSEQFAPKANATRAEASVMILRMYQQL